MTWSTRQLAELAGTTVKTVRHYHDMGVLELPERTANGYKQYRTAHLARLLQVKRLTEFGLSLSEIRAMGGQESPDDALDRLDAELAETIERLQRIRTELAATRASQAPLDIPARFGSLAERLSPEDRVMLTVFSGVLQETALEDLRTLMTEHAGEDADLDRLTVDARDEEIEAVARRLAGAMARDHARFPWLADPGSAALRGRASAEAALGNAVAERCNAAQLKALALAKEYLKEGRQDR
ncbi:MerR family transcriptional regulator [Amycolatopsis panacis]|uniref:MerR family transcriptional regulator n=1 Tax=Amycolatopsis panacis TaxID=2340917 RepID=A0A419I631_9PSEU|nr:MerR family transcriptional regulator [Amycolatopsis panacis]RJQ86630.1 MerR family transcriptional regulator [Amycolatopsis panacis]